MCDQTSWSSVHHGEINWLVIPCTASNNEFSCARSLELPIPLDTELIESLIRIVKEDKRLSFRVLFYGDPYYVMPHAIVPIILSTGDRIDRILTRESVGVLTHHSNNPQG